MCYSIRLRYYLTGIGFAGRSCRGVGDNGNWAKFSCWNMSYVKVIIIKNIASLASLPLRFFVVLM